MSSTSGHRQVLARNLTFGAASNQAAGQRPVVSANKVPLPDSQIPGDRPLAITVLKPKAVGQIWGSFWLTRRPPTQRIRPATDVACAAAQIDIVQSRAVFGTAQVKALQVQAKLSGNPRGVLPVSLAIALANAGASGGKPGSPMPVGASALGTMCTAMRGMSVMLATT